MSPVRLARTLSFAATAATALLLASSGARTDVHAQATAAAPAGTAGTAAAPTTADAQERFLQDADVVASRRLGKGVTNPWRLTLRLGDVTHETTDTTFGLAGSLTSQIVKPEKLPW